MNGIEEEVCEHNDIFADEFATFLEGVDFFELGVVNTAFLNKVFRDLATGYFSPGRCVVMGETRESFLDNWAEGYIETGFDKFNFGYFKSEEVRPLLGTFSRIWADKYLKEEDE